MQPWCEEKWFGQPRRPWCCGCKRGCGRETVQVSQAVYALGAVVIRRRAGVLPPLRMLHRGLRLTR